VLSIWEKPPRVAPLGFCLASFSGICPRILHKSPQISTNLHLSPLISRMSKISTAGSISDNLEPMFSREIPAPSGTAPSDAYCIWGNLPLCLCTCTCVSWKSLSCLCTWDYVSSLHLYM
jgi:hypothetical protein